MISLRGIGGSRRQQQEEARLHNLVKTGTMYIQTGREMFTGKPMRAGSKEAVAAGLDRKAALALPLVDQVMTALILIATPRLGKEDRTAPAIISSTGVPVEAVIADHEEEACPEAGEEEVVDKAISNNKGTLTKQKKD